MAYKAPTDLRPRYLFPTFRLPAGQAGRERNPSEAKTSSLTPTSSHSKFFAKGDKKKMASKKALTLIELLIVFAIMSVVTMVLGSVFVSHLKLFNNVKSLIDVSSSNKLVLDELITQIRESVAIVSTCSACGGKTTGADTLILQLWPLDTGNNPTEPTTNNFDYVLYYRDSAKTINLIKKIIPDPSSSRTASTKIMASDISSLIFSYDNLDPTLAYEITATVQNSLSIAGKTQTTSQQVKTVLRNK